MTARPEHIVAHERAAYRPEAVSLTVTLRPDHWRDANPANALRLAILEAVTAWRPAENWKGGVNHQPGHPDYGRVDVHSTHMGYVGELPAWVLAAQRLGALYREAAIGFQLVLRAA